MLPKFLLMLSIFAFIPVLTLAGDLEDGRAAIQAGDYDTAVRLLRPLAVVGNDDAQNALGVLYLQGWGVERDYSLASGWFQKAVDQGNAKAAINLGELYVKGKGVRQDYARAAGLYHSFAQQGHAGAQLRLGLLYDKGLGVKRDDVEAARWYRRAAEQGDPLAQGLLGAMYATGQGLAQDFTLAMHWYLKSATQENSESQYRVGYMYEHGEGVAPNKAEAANWYGVAAEQGHSEAIARLEALEHQERNGAAGEPTVDMAQLVGNLARMASAADLAQGYLSAKYVAEVLIPAAESGATVEFSGETVTAGNAEAFRRRYQQRLSILGDEIENRDYRSIAGTYSGSATEACGRIQAAWVGVIHEGSARSIVIAQTGFEARVIVKVEYEGKEWSLDNAAAITDSAIVVVDTMNPAYYFHGNIKTKNIEIRPNVRSLESWPRWAGPPNQSDLENCVITLKPRFSD